MPSDTPKTRNSAPLRSDVLTEAAAVWATVAPSPLVRPREGIDYTVDSYAKAHNITSRQAQTVLAAKAKGPKAVLKRAMVRLVSDPDGRPMNVYWPATVEPPAGVVAE